METNKALSKDQLEKLNELVRQRFDDLYQRIGTNRQKLATTVLQVHQAINKEITKEEIDTDKEKDIVRKIRDIERAANNQLPHLHKFITPPATAAKAKPIVEAKPKAAKPKAEAKPKPAPKVKAEAKSKVAAKPKAKPKTKKK